MNHPGSAYEELEGLWTRICASPTSVAERLVLLVGPSGVGRSWLLRQLEQQVSATGTARAVRAAWKPGTDRLDPFMQIADGRFLCGRIVTASTHKAVRMTTTALERAPWIKWAMTAAREFLSLERHLFGQLPFESARDDEQFTEAYCQRLRRLVAERPMLALLDDADQLHDAESLTLGFVGRITAAIASRPALLVMAYATDGPALARLQDKLRASLPSPIWKIIHVPLMTKANARALADKLLAGHPAAREVDVTRREPIAAGRS
jgi:AAA ATPase-like protein